MAGTERSAHDDAGGVNDPPGPVADTAEVDRSARLGAGTRVWQLAQVREGAVLGVDCTIGRGAYVGADVRIGDRVKIQNSALVYELADDVFVGPAAVLTNDRQPRAVRPDGGSKTAADWSAVGVRVGRGASLGAASVCVAPLTVGAWAMVGAGAVVTRDVPRPARRAAWSPDTVTADLTFYANGVSPVEWDTIAAFRGVVEGDMVRYANPKPEPLLSELSAFVAAVRGEGSDVVTKTEAVGVVETAEAVVRSATTGLPVLLDVPQT